MSERSERIRQHSEPSGGEADGAHWCPVISDPVGLSHEVMVHP
ncbi:MAG TPA: hypothetical protein VEW93_06700 [Acidimicrobiales bacterium]|nr:hypothetical protein [Acidimicrobiales bacterium]